MSTVNSICHKPWHYIVSTGEMIQIVYCKIMEIERCVGAKMNFFSPFVSFHFISLSGIKQKMAKATKQNTLVLCVEGAMEKIIYMH